MTRSMAKSPVSTRAAVSLGPGWQCVHVHNMHLIQTGALDKNVFY